MRAGFVLDLGRCLGCAACVLACRLEHGWPSASPRRRVVALNAGRHPGGPTYFLSLACHHCENPICLRGCPAGAYQQRADGIVVHHEERCVGCRHCEMACPFGAPRFDARRRVMSKCDFCRARVDAGEVPACVAACPTEALRVADDERRASRVANPQSEAFIPGFCDPTGCRPSIRFEPPNGIRGQRLAELMKEIGKTRR